MGLLGVIGKLKQLSYRTVTKHRNGSRLWIDGAKLEMAGFAKGEKYKRERVGDTITLTLSPDGDYVVVGKTKFGVIIPVIDMTMTPYKEDYPIGTKIRAIFTAGSITISIHHERQRQAEREARFIEHLANGEVTEGSCCTGGAISTTAAHDGIVGAGLKGKLAWVVDADIRYLQSAFANSYAITDETACFESTLEELETKYLSQVDVLTFSLPCAGISQAGKSKHKLSAEEHESGTALFGIRDIIVASNPAMITSENVKDAKDSPIYILLKQELIRLGYVIIEKILTNQNTGSFEARPRYWFMALSSGLPAKWLEGVFDFYLPKKQNSFGEILDINAPESMWSDNQYLKDKQVRDEAAGHGYANRQLITADTESIGVIGRHYNKKRSSEPFVVRPDGKERLLTLGEHAAVKQIPPVLIRNCGPTVGHQILGQSIDYLQALVPVQRFFLNCQGLDLSPAGA